MSPGQLMTAVRNRKSVSLGDCLGGGRMPAAFLANMQFWRVMQMLPRLRIYKANRNQRKKSL